MDFIKHTVKKGENLSKIAKGYGFAGGDWVKIYKHPKNSAFRKLRPDPDLIEPKDELFVPGTPGKDIDAEMKSLKAMLDKLNSMPLSVKKVTMEAQRMAKEAQRITKTGALIQTDIQKMRGMQAMHRAEVQIMDQMTTKCSDDAKGCVAATPRSFAVFEKRQAALGRLINTLKTIDEADKHLRRDPTKAMFAVGMVNKDMEKIRKLTAEWTKAHTDAVKEIESRIKELGSERKLTV
ncbi:N-acetylmuramoyl-L-alanine amidase [Sulfitobacter noctilucae]|uniref:LysM peptidoglycan-binding domain-containing protein n=1 Tax=Sulfitobacter noctilucae TaxID=1342302 RepID=UPI000A51FACD|nr:LysM domain-containing protein [Sulfitobacter noctilucae]KIN65713.1 N-acetylmuramoyl-L-alanine amidase [Sulfitobacter noctilucae]